MRLIAFNSPTEGSFPNVSFSDLPGAFILSAVREPYWLADALIHELLHNRLFFIIERGEILERGEGAEPSEFYSPWRDDSNDGNLYALTDGRRGSITEKWSVCTCQSRDPLAGDRRRRHDLHRTDQ